MRAAVVVTGVLGLGTALVFAAAGLVSAAFPNGTLVPSGWNGAWGGGWGKGGIEVPAPMPLPMPVDGIPEKGVVIQGGVSVDLAPAMPGGTDDDIIAQP